MLDYLPSQLFEQLPCQYQINAVGSPRLTTRQTASRIEQQGKQGIDVDCQLGRFYLQGDASSYVMRIDPDLTLIHEHWGPPVSQLGDPIVPPLVQGWPNRLGCRPQELPGPSGVDRRAPALLWEGDSGALACQLQVVGANIVAGKPKLPCLPTTFATAVQGCITLAICLQDPGQKLQVWSYYSLFPKTDTIARWLSITCLHGFNCSLYGAASFSVDMPPYNYKAMILAGRWSAEGKIIEQTLRPGAFRIASRWGFSGHEHNPFMAIGEQQSDDQHGPVWGLTLHYSGDFWAQASIAGDHSLRWQMGLGQEGFCWRMRPAQPFVTPESIAIFSAHGFGDMSRKFHRFWREHLCKQPWQHLPRPVKLNTWEACYFKIDLTTCQQLAQAAQPLGISLLVIDDGWFGQHYPRLDDTSSLGDWQLNSTKFPGGWSVLRQQLAQTKMQLGIWIEPEMISVQSQLYAQHPNWCLQVPNTTAQEVRQQRLLDLSNPEVQAWLITTVVDLLRSSEARYVKWDANRGMSEIGSTVWPRAQQGEIAHRYMLGLYAVLERITTAFPDVLFEHCASGGGRFDAGMLHYMPQGWTSDNTDARERLRIQWGLGLLYPAATMVAHLASSPHHQMGRTSSWSFRAHVAAMTGCVGLELDVRQLSLAEQQELRSLLQAIDSIAHLVRDGQQYRLQPNAQVSMDPRWPAAMWVAPDQREAVLFAFQLDSEVGLFPPPLRLAGLLPAQSYRCVNDGNWPGVWSGRTLMGHGLPIHFTQDNQSTMLHWRACDAPQDELS